MKNIKKITLSLMVVLLTSCNFNFGLDLAGLSKSTKKIIEFVNSPEGKEFLDLVGGSVKVLADGTIELLGNKSAEIVHILADGTIVASSQIGVEAVKELVRQGEKYMPLAWAGLALIGAGEGYLIIKDMKKTSSEIESKLHPCNKDASEDLKYEEEYNLRKAKKVLRLSMVKNAKGERGQLGLPIACDEDVKSLIIAGGEAELEQLSNYFKKSYGEFPC